jgi:hypothetical protein
MTALFEDNAARFGAGETEGAPRDLKVLDYIGLGTHFFYYIFAAEIILGL